MVEMSGEAVGKETMRQKMCLSPRAEDHVQYARQHIDLGFTHLYFHCAGPDQTSFLERYGSDVLPRIRQEVGRSGRRETAGAEAPGRERRPCR